MGTYIEELDVVEDVIIESKVVGRNDVHSSILLDLPVCQSESLALGEEVGLRELASPVGLVGLLEVTKDSHTAVNKNMSAGLFPGIPPNCLMWKLPSGGNKEKRKNIRKSQD